MKVAAFVLWLTLVVGQCSAYGPFSISLARAFSSRLRSQFQSVQVKDNDVIPAPTCNTLECPPYELIHQETDFEVRRYRNATYVSTEEIQEVSFNRATYKGFKRLFDYIEGENEASAHIPMTAPVQTAIVPSGGPFCSSAFAVKFFVPHAFADDPPAPTNALRPNLHIARDRTTCVVVRKFGGFATDANVASEAAALAASLKSTAWSFVAERSGGKGESYIVAQYNSPFEFTKRVNEIWVKFSVGDKGLETCLPSTE